MDTQNRAMPHLVLALLTFLALVAVSVSVHWAPASAAQALRLAAKNTETASGFVLTDTVTAVPDAPSAASDSVREVTTVVYRAPNEVEETLTANGRSVSLLVLGAARYERSGGGPWTALNPGIVSVPVGRAAAHSVLRPIVALETATDVVAHGDRYAFQPADASLLLADLLGVRSRQLSTRDTSWQATVTGEFVSSLGLTTRVPGEKVTLRLDLTSIGHPPALVAPQPGR